MYGIHHKICLFLTFFILISIVFLPFIQAEKSLTEISKEKIQEDYSETYKPRPYNIRFISGQFTPNPSAKEMIMTSSLQKNRYYLVQFFNLSEDDYNKLLSQNVKILGYVPDSTYVIKDPDGVLKSGSYNIRWIGALSPEQKIELGLKTFLENATDEKINITLILFENPEIQETEIIEGIGNVIHSKSTENFVVLETYTNRIFDLANLDFVQFIYKYEPVRMLLDYSSKIVSADYVWDQGNDASGVTVGIIDSGIQRDNSYFAGPDGVYGTSDDIVTIYYAHDWAGNDTMPEAECGDIDPHTGIANCNDGFDNDGDGEIDEGIHGILVAGVIAGQGTYYGRAIKGISSNADLAISRIFDKDGNSVMSGGEPELWKNILDRDNDGDYNEPSSADVISISWGIDNGLYTVSSAKADEVVNGLLTNGSKKALVVAAAGNDGETKKVLAPATGKNVLTVGATANFRLLNGYCYNSICYDPNNLMVVNFSSRGTNDGRVKPDILAPGAFITTSSIDNGYTVAAGTSFAAPHVSAVAAQILHDYPSATPELIKSMIIASAVGGGTTDNTNMAQGWGRLNAYSAVYQTPDEYYDQYHVGTVGNSKSGYPVKRGCSFYVPEDADKLIVTMVYSDDAGPFFSGHLNNDLDLSLQTPSGSTELPNGHETYADDNVNNVEKYVIENPQSGDWNAWIEGILFNDLYGSWAKSIDYAVNIRVIKRTRQPDINIMAYASPYKLNEVPVFFDVFADVYVNGLNERDVYAQIVETYDEISVVRPVGIPITENEKINILGDIPADSSRRTRNFELVVTKPGRYNIYVNAYGRDELNTFQGAADTVEVIVCDQDEDGYYDSDCGGTDCNDTNPDINPGQPENCSNGIDDDCDGAIDASDPDCVICSCGEWQDQGCGRGSCLRDQMLQTRSCNPPGCSSEERCISHESCGDDWAMFQHDSGFTGYSTSKIAMPLVEIWNYAKGNETYSSPSIVNGMVFVGSDNGNIYAFNASNGKILWNYTAGGGIKSSLAVVNDVVFAGSADGYLYALNMSTGNLISNCSVGGTSPPNVANESVYLISGNRLNSLNYTTCELMWSYEFKDFGNPLSGVISGEWVTVYSLPAVSNNVVYIGVYYTYIYKEGEYFYYPWYENYVYAVYRNGTLKWKSKFIEDYGISSSPTIDVKNEAVYIGGGEFGGLFALNLSTGERKCIFGGHFFRMTTSPAVSSDLVFIAVNYRRSDYTYYGYVYAINATTSSLKWSYKINSELHSSPAIADGIVFIGSDNGNIYAFNASNGKILWNYTAGGAIGSSPAIANSMLFVSSGDGKLYAFGSACSDECSADETRCNGNIKQTCGNYDADSCLEWPFSTSGAGNEPCGETTNGSWSKDYCTGRNVTRNRTVCLRGCSLGSCYENETLEIDIVETCPYICREGNCTTLEGDVNGDCTVNIFDLAAVGLAFGSVPGDSNWDPDADIYPSGGDWVINIFDLAMVGLNYGEMC